MDKSWINAHIKSTTYRKGVESFIEFARARGIRGSIICPCLRCCNDELLEVEEVHDHLLRYGFLPGYTIWTIHGELATPPTSQSTSVHETYFVKDDMIGLVRDAFGLSYSTLNHENTEEEMLDGEEDESAETSDHNVEDIPYKKLLEQCDEELYPGCKFSSLSFTLRLYHIKCIGGISNKAFSMILELLRDAFPHITSLPSSAHQTKKLTNDLGLGYKKIHACPNDCMLYWDKSEGEQSCHTCKASRYRSNGDQLGESSNSRKSKKPAKVLRYFPLIPRLKRLYKCETTAKDMRWHDMGRTKDGKLRHPGDGLAWKAFNDRYPKFASDPRSVRLGLASDGCNPFRTMNTQHSTWPVLLIPYNLPPWICMKQQSFILSAIIQGEKGPGNDIDVYLQPLIQELNLLWKGVDAYDAFSKERFKLRASLLWTVNDFPAYANLSGWSTKGRVACPTCANSTRSMWLKHGKKFCYMGHRRWLEENHPYRFQKDRFDGTIKVDGPPTIMLGSDILKQLRGSSFKYGKLTKSNKKRRRYDVGCSKSSPLPKTNDKSSAFDDIESFIEEDIDGDNQLWKKRNGKTKDNENARKDLMEMRIRHELHLRNGNGNGNRNGNMHIKRSTRDHLIGLSFFDLSYQSRDGSYIHGMSKDFMERAREEMTRRELQISKSRPVDDEVRS
ncbi:hypothetical protein Tco_1084104 [Tanacetum coccineum]